MQIRGAECNQPAGSTPTVPTIQNRATSSSSSSQSQLQTLSADCEGSQEHSQFLYPGI